MILITRHPGEYIEVGEDIVITVVEIKGKIVKLGVECPKNFSIARSGYKEKK